MKSMIWSLLCVLLLVSGAIGCVRSEPAAPAVEPRIATQKGDAAVKGGDRTWDNMLQEARKEGSVVLYTIWVPEIRTSLVKAFKDKYGLDLEITSFMRGSDQVAKIEAEQRAGLFMADVFGSGATTFLNQMKPARVLGPLEPMLVIPEVTSAQNWLGGRFPFVDQDKLVIAMMFSKQSDIIYNTDMVKQGEITTYTDLLKPQYKGKITLNDPTVTGVANFLVTYLAYGIWDVDRAKDFLKRLIVEQGVVIQRDDRVHVESVAKGKFSVGVAARNPILEEFLRAGAPVAVVDIKDGTAASTGSGAMAVPPRGPHPNAAAVFVNWLLTKEGQTVFSKGFGSPSLRTDVSTEGLHPAFVPRQGEKIFMQNEQTSLKAGDMLAVAKQIIDQYQK
ncbi:MAG: ABC transporter substrate-binding protein [Chloroflexi bacterium]|nr:ABC transporter substrate-binding protein [Chloroflexota bacterium]